MAKKKKRVSEKVTLPKNWGKVFDGRVWKAGVSDAADAIRYSTYPLEEEDAETLYYSKLDPPMEVPAGFSDWRGIYGSSDTFHKGEPESILIEADRLVSTEREAEYGPIEDNASRTIGAYYALKGTYEIKTPLDHCLYMTLYKLGRECTRHKRDNLRDAPGYIKLMDRLHGGK